MKVRALYSLFKMRWIEGLQYRVAAFAGVSVSVFWAIIEITIYTVFFTYANHAQSGLLAGLTLSQTICYVWLAQSLFIMQLSGMDGDIAAKIQNGNVGLELCKPLDLYAHWFSNIAAGRLVTLVWRGGFILLAGVIASIFGYGLIMPASFWGFFLFVCSFFSAFILCVAYSLLLCAFRIHIAWGDGLVNLFMLISSLLSGVYLPLQLWPDQLQRFLLLQPFAGYLDIPMRLYLGTITRENAGLALGIQWIWIAIFIWAGRKLMASRLRNIVIQGG